MKTQRLTLSFLLAVFCFYNTTIAQTTFVSGWKYREAYQDATAIGNGSWKTNAYSDVAWAMIPPIDALLAYLFTVTNSKSAVTQFTFIPL